MPGVTGSGSGHTIGVETGHTNVTVYGNRAYMCIPHEYIVVGSSSLSESVSSSFIAQHRHACSAMLIATSNHANTHPAESTSHRARNTSPHTHSSPAIVGFSTDNLKMPYALRTRKPPRIAYSSCASSRTGYGQRTWIFWTLSQLPPQQSAVCALVRYAPPC